MVKTQVFIQKSENCTMKLKNRNIIDDLPDEKWRIKEAHSMMRYINESKSASISDLVTKTGYSRERIKQYLKILEDDKSIEIKETKAKTIILPTTRNSLIERFSETLKEIAEEMEDVMTWDDGEREIMLAYFIFLGELFLVQIRCQSKVTPGFNFVLEDTEKQWEEFLNKHDLTRKWNEDEFHNAFFSESFIRFGQSVLENFDNSKIELIGSLNKSFGVKV